MCLLMWDVFKLFLIIYIFVIVIFCVYILVTNAMSQEFDVNVPDFTDKVAKKCIEVYEKLPKNGKPKPDEYTVLSGVLLFDRSTGSIEVVSIGTGTKCIGAGKLTPTGGVLHDSHAEIIARRGFLIYMYDTMKRTLEGEATILKFQEDKFELGDNYEFHLYSSQLPCGDACIMPKLHEDIQLIGLPVINDHILEPLKEQTDEDKDTDSPVRKKHRLSSDIERTGAKCLPHSEQDKKEPGSKYHLLGQVRTKPGRGERTLSVSCSDKISKWIHMGIQGSLMGMLLDKPIYLKSIIIGGGIPYSQESIARALISRNPDFIVKNAPTCEQSSVIFPYIKSESRMRPGPASIVWVNLNESLTEVSVNGIKMGVIKKHAVKLSSSLSISKYNLYKRFMLVALLCEHETGQKLVEDGPLMTTPYNKMKRNNIEYFDKWHDVKRNFFSNWTTKPDIWNFIADCDDVTENKKKL